MLGTLRLLTLVALMLVTDACRADPAINMPVHLSRLLAWTLGDDISQAAILHEEGKGPKSDAMLDASSKLASGLGIVLPPLPAVASDKQKALVDVVDYEMALNQRISDKLGHVCGVLFMASAQTDLLFVTYTPGDGFGVLMANATKSSLAEVGVPERLWMAPIDAVMARKPQPEVWQAVGKMHDDVRSFLDAAVQASGEVKAQPDAK